MTMRRRIRRVLKRPHPAAAASPTPASSPASPPPAEPVPGVVELFSRRLVLGWVSVPDSAAPTRVDLHVGPTRIASTYATPDVPMVGVSHQPGREAGRDVPQMPQSIPSRRDHRRNSAHQVRVFSFRVRGIWRFVNPRNRITVRVDGAPLPIVGHGMYLSPPRAGELKPADLREILDSGHVLTQHGDIALSKKLDTAWQADTLDLYGRVRSFLADRFDLDLFVIYGTLLGAVRDDGFIGHDVDFDAAYRSRHTTGQAAAEELVEIGLALVEAGYEVEVMVACLHVALPDKPESRIDIFHTYCEPEELGARWRFPFGVAGTTTLTAHDWQGTEERSFAGANVLVPVAAEETIRHLYGDDWRLPKPGFNWSLDRTDAATDGAFTAEQRTKVYWANFYARTEYTEGSTFFSFVERFPDLPTTVIDIGCGDGRDACAFGAAGRRVLGLDQSPVGIEHAAGRAAALGLADAEFATCDVGDRDALSAHLDKVREQDEPVVFYLRFFLHAIHPEAQETLLDAIGACSRPGDMFAAEFRTDKDADREKVHGRHYRRFQNAEELVADLHRRGWPVLHFEEGTGLSPYQGEDPVLARVVARR
ncbi:methyltransferase domain-containing protein [Nocardioides sp. GY 10113]|uniref:class I SAM-dependent methyltransferase n=1 Tax=Nocardioides sp. GY 10113 TaxID=2569761 RepID=UPI0010A79D1C|nr:class I SAM-dependent methyltransferase [Nocardioides sp. GY 10113]TIC89222.1 methyltransferase domain-containing protein [Nocardioides sp. GY 10113]